MDPTTTHTVPTKTTNIPPRASLQGIPRELRDMIYEHVANDEEERIVLGRRFVEAHKDDSLPLDECFAKAVALHPLSMTCRQMREEYQHPHHSQTREDVRWVLVVNNFDIGQFELFCRYATSGIFFDYQGWVGEDPWPEFVLRFQMDSGAVRSAVQLCEYIREEDRLEHISWGRDNGFHITMYDLRGAEFVLHYRPRTTLPVSPSKSLLVGEAKCIELLFRNLPAHVSHPCENGEAIISAAQYKWFEPFYEAVEQLQIELGPAECERDDLEGEDFWVYHD